jgi:eukaryotic-like serine/threonine-protein kinase
MPSLGPGESEPLSQRFIRCHHCGLPHNLSDEVCPITGKSIRRQRKSGAPGTSEKEESGRHAMPIPLVSQRQSSGARRAVASPEREEHRLIGRIIGDKYRVLDLIGEGGMGTVYEAEHLEIGRRVAIKVLNRAHLGRKEAVARFHQEARAAGAIGHPNICEIYDVGRLGDGSPYLVMERLHGQTLSDRINIEGALPFDDVISILTQVLSALVAAHQKRIIHRDIKPENIFLTERVGCTAVVKILDFGISKSGSDQGDLSLTRTGMVMGTPFYMAPEQARGEHIDHRVDIYAGGVILYETLTGRRPFLASNYNALVIQVLSKQPIDPREFRPAIPAAFVPVVFKALSKRREDRYDDAAGFIEALSEVQSELGRGPTNAEIKKLAEEVRSRPPPALLPSDYPADSMDIPVVFSETGTGQQPVSLETGEVDVDLETGPHASEGDATLVGDSHSFHEEKASGVRVFGANHPNEDEEVNDTIVDPSGAMLGEIWAQLERAKEQTRKSTPADATERTNKLDRESAESLLRNLDDPDGGATEADGKGEEDASDGRYSLVSSFPEAPDDDGRAARAAMATEPQEELEDKTTQRPTSHAKAPRPSVPAGQASRAPIPSPPKRSTSRKRTKIGAPPPAPSSKHDANEPEDDAVTTLFVASDDGPKEVASNEKDRGLGPKIPRPPGTPRL